MSKKSVQGNPFFVLEGRVLLEMSEQAKKRGIGERNCGRWTYKRSNLTDHELLKNDFSVCLLYGSLKEKAWKKLKTHSSKSALDLSNPDSKVMGLTNTESAKGNHKFSISLLGDVDPLTVSDLCDLFSTPKTTVPTTERAKKQSLVFPLRQDEIGREKGNLSCQTNPLFSTIPEGARLLSVLASERRRDYCICLPKECKGKNTKDEESLNATHELVIVPTKVESNINCRWYRLGTQKQAINPSCSVEASILPIEGPNVLYCVCANSLEIKSGGIRAEGLTMLQGGKIFLVLCKLSFGLLAVQQGSSDAIDTCLAWADSQSKEHHIQSEWKRRASKAVEFHSGCEEMGETLHCRPEIVEKLLDIFDNLDGLDSLPVWDDVTQDIFSLV